RLDAEAQEAEEGLDQYDGRNRQRGVDDDRPEDVGQDVAEKDPPAPEAQRPGRLDELHALDRHDLPANNAGHGQPFHGADGHEEQDDIPPKEHHQENHEQREGQGVKDVDDAHHGGVQHAADETRHRPVDNSDGQRDHGGAQADGEGDASAV